MTTLKVIQTTEVEDYVNMLADRLEAQYKEYHIRSLTKFTSEWANNELESIKNGTWNGMRFVVTKGRKYFKITEYRKGSCYSKNENEYRLGKVNCFVDIKTGDVYKPISYHSKAPYTKYAKYNLLDADSREECLSKADWMGGHLYLEENSDYEKYWLTEELTKKYIG